MKQFVATLAFLFLATAVAEANITLIGGLSRDTEVSPGETVEERIVVQNGGDGTVDVVVEQADLRRRSDGRSEYLDPGSLDRSNADWVVLETNRLTVGAGERASIRFSIHVPDNEDLRGTYFSTLRVRPAPTVAPSDDESAEEEEIRAGVGFRAGYRVNLFTHIRDRPGTRDLSVFDRTVETDPGRNHVRLSVTFENTGDRLLRPRVWAELFDEQGEMVGRFGTPVQFVLPGGYRTYRTNLTGVPPGTYTVLIVADAGEDALFGARYEIEVPDPDDRSDDEPDPDDPDPDGEEDRNGGNGEDG